MELQLSHTLKQIGAESVCCSLASPAHASSAFNRLHRASATDSCGEREREFPRCKSLASSSITNSSKEEEKKTHFRSMRGNTTPGRDRERKRQRKRVLHCYSSEESDAKE
jgi:hypothetical protein